MGSKMARCNFCGRTFSSAQGVRAHLKSCPKYQVSKNKPIVPPREPIRQPREPQADLPKKLPREAPVSRPHPNPDTYKAPASKPSDAKLLHDRLVREAEERARREAAAAQQQEKERRRQREEAEARERKRRDVIQHAKFSAVDCHFLVIPAEAKAKAKVEIERELSSLPVHELPMIEVTQIAQGIRDRIYAPYLNAQNEQNNARKEANAMGKTKLYSGIFYCQRCDLEFELDRADAKDLVCDECGGQLKEDDEDE